MSSSSPPPFQLFQSYPNPFSASTAIEYTLRAPASIALTIYNVRGQRVARLTKLGQSRGNHVITWNGLDDKGKQAASGLYFYRLQAGSFSQTKKMVLLR